MDISFINFMNAGYFFLPTCIFTRSSSPIYSVKRACQEIRVESITAGGVRVASLLAECMQINVKISTCVFGSISAIHWITRWLVTLMSINCLLDKRSFAICSPSTRSLSAVV